MESIDTALSELQSHSSSHPVIVAMWSEYLLGLKDACTGACEQARLLIRDLPQLKDPSSYKQIAAVYALTQQ